MPAHRRWLSALAAVCTLLLVAAVLAAFGHTAGPANTRVGAAARRTPARGSALPPATATSAPATSTTTPNLPPPTSPYTSTAPSTSAPAAPAAPDLSHRWAVGTMTFTFVDSTRPTPPAPGDAGQASRVLPTIVRYPAAGAPSDPERAGAAASPSAAPFPLIVFAHGYNTSPGAYASLLHAWSSAGYVVAAPSFPRATEGGPLDEDDLANQPGDLSLVITKILALAGPGGPLAALVDTHRVGVAGHSDGASTTAGIGYNTCCRDGRVLADAVMEGDEHAFPGGKWFQAGPAPPLLLIQADHDVFNPTELGLRVYRDAASPKYLLSLVNAQHFEPYATDLAHLAVIEAVTTSFFDRFLKGRIEAEAAMRRSSTPGLATLTIG